MWDGGGEGGGFEGGSSAYRHPPRANESYIAESGAPVLTGAAVCQDTATLAFTLTSTVHSDPISPFCGTLHIKHHAPSDPLKKKKKFCALITVPV